MKTADEYFDDPETNDFFVPKMKETLAQYQAKDRTNKPWWKLW